MEQAADAVGTQYPRKVTLKSHLKRPQNVELFRFVADRAISEEPYDQKFPTIAKYGDLVAKVRQARSAEVYRRCIWRV